jgi:hypothetical protein
MNFESPDEPDMNEQWQPDGGGDDTSFGEHDPTGGILPDGAYDDLSDTETSRLTSEVPTFGLQRFENMEPQFEGDPPQEYIDATTTPFDRLVNHDDGHQAKYDCLFLDRDESPHTTSVYPNDIAVITHTDLEHVTSEGRVQIRLDFCRAEVRFLDNDGQTVSYVNYYMMPDKRRDNSGAHYATVRKDAVDPLTRGDIDTTGMDEDDALILRSDVEREYLKKRYYAHLDGAVNPLVSIEEANYVFGEVLANARPVVKTYEDVMMAVEHQLAKPPEPRLEGNNPMVPEYVRTYKRLFNAYQQVVATPEETATWNHETHREHIAVDGSGTTEHITGIIPKNRITGPETTYTIIVHTENLDDVALAKKITEGRIRDVPVPAVAGGKFTTEIRFRGTGEEVVAEFRRSLTIGDVGSWHWKPRSFTPTKHVMRTVRNYLWGDVEEPGM